MHALEADLPICSCCQKSGQFCRCNRVKCQRCKLCVLHCVCSVPLLASPPPKKIPSEAEKSMCKGCGTEIFWVVTPKGKNLPLDPDGTPHWARCKTPEIFRKKGYGK